MTVVDFALNHITTARLGFEPVLDAARALGCVGVELRTDLGRPLFDGLAPEAAGERLRDRGLRLLALAEVRRFDDWTEGRAAEALALMRTARAAGAEAVVLIPRDDGGGLGPGERQGRLRIALEALLPMLEDHGLTGLVEPLGFATCSLRDKAEAVAAIEGLGAAGRLRLVHDTFHHHLAGGGPLHPRHTGIVHVSGVVDPAPAPHEMADRHRGLVDGADRLGTLAQLRALREAGWSGPVSLECFAPEVQALADPVPALRASLDHIRLALSREAA